MKTWYRCLTALAVLCIATSGCGTPGGTGPARPISYVGSSTIAQYLRHAEEVNPRFKFVIDTAPESIGGERAILKGEAELAGVAARLSPEIETAGIRATLIGRDGIAVIARSDLTVHGLSSAQLKGIFTNKIKSWKEVGGPDKPIKPFIVSVSSATHKVFRSVLLGADDYVGCEVVAPDPAIVEKVAGTEGAIGQISFSFLNGAKGVRPLWVDDQEPAVTNFDYPITRPLYLLTRSDAPSHVLDFVEWTLSRDGQQAVMRFFIGGKVLGAGRGTPSRGPLGTLVVYTATFAVYDGGVYYYPHLPYDIYEIGGKLIRHVCNHRSDNDETPARIDLPPGKYLIRADTAGTERIEFIVTLEAGKLTEVDVAKLPRRTEK